MVYANDKKFACESCIKGHRSSSCHHADRPLFEIKKKGRPVSQCDKCRQLRQSKKIHAKCICNIRSDQPIYRIPIPSNGTRSKRYIPVAPSLPNGLKDLTQDSSTPVLCPGVLLRANSLPNPCKCGDSSQCKCYIPSDHLTPTVPVVSNNSAFSMAAVICRNEMDKITRTEDITPGLQLPPIQNSPHGPSHPSAPDFPIIPPLSTFASLAGSGCTCGLRCACPGCIEHRGPENTLPDHKDCVDGCGSCVDERTATLPSSPRSVSMGILDRFFAHAAALPPPPLRKGGGVHLDPMDVTVYPDSAWESKESAVAFGLVHLPKLECCGGRCGCPDSQCGCGLACDGACAMHVIP